MSDSEVQAANVLSRYRTAILNKDVDGMMALYADDVRVFDAWGVWAYEGAAAWRQAVEQWFGSLQDETVKVGLEDIRTDGGWDLAVVSAVASGPPGSEPGTASSARPAARSARPSAGVSRSGRWKYSASRMETCPASSSSTSR